jgi:hypothetical protein
VDVWVADLKNGTGSVSHGPSDAKVDTTLKMAEDDFVALAAGKLNAMQAFMKGKLKISGNMMLAQKLQGVFEAAKKAAPASNAPAKVQSKVNHDIALVWEPYIAETRASIFRLRLCSKTWRARLVLTLFGKRELSSSLS